MKKLVLTLAFGTLTCGGLFAQQVRKQLAETPAMATLSYVPKDFIGTDHAAFEVVIAYNQIQRTLERFQAGMASASEAQFAVELIAQPCLSYEIIHDTAYESGAHKPRYPKADSSEKASSVEKYYIKAPLMLRKELWPI